MKYIFCLIFLIPTTAMAQYASIETGTAEPIVMTPTVKVENLECPDSSYSKSILNANGDINCCKGNVCYGYNSQATQDANAAAQAAQQVITDAANQQQQLVEDAKTAVAVQYLQDNGLIDDTQATAQTAKLSTLNTATSAKASLKVTPN